MSISMELLNQLRVELDKERREKNKYFAVLEKIANGYDPSSSKKTLDKEDMTTLALKAISPTN